MGAFDPLFRRRQQVPMYRRRSGIGSVLGLGGLGYMLYRYMQTPHGQEMKTNVVDQFKNATKRWQSGSEEINPL